MCSRYRAQAGMSRMGESRRPPKASPSYPSPSFTASTSRSCRRHAVRRLSRPRGVCRRGGIRPHPPPRRWRRVPSTCAWSRAPCSMATCQGLDALLPARGAERHHPFGLHCRSRDHAIADQPLADYVADSPYTPVRGSPVPSPTSNPRPITRRPQVRILLKPHQLLENVDISM